MKCGDNIYPFSLNPEVVQPLLGVGRFAIIFPPILSGAIQI